MRVWRRISVPAVVAGGMGIGLACSQLPLQPEQVAVYAVPLEWLREFLRDPIINLLFSAGVGGAVGAGVSKWFAKASSDELKQESAKLRRLSDILARGLEERGIAKFNWGEDGSLVSNAMVRKPSGGQPSATGTLSSVHTPASDPLSTPE